MMAAMASAKRKHPKWFVATGGSDSNNGLSTSTPVATIGRVNTLVNASGAAGDIVTVAPGTYTDTGGTGATYSTGIYNSKSGSAGAPITFLCEVPYSAKITSSGVTPVNPQPCAWMTTGDWVTLKNFDFDASTSGSHWQIIVEMNGNHETIEGCKLHDWLTSATDFNVYAATFAMAVHPDSWVFGGGGVGKSLTGFTISRNMFFNIGPNPSGTVGGHNNHSGHPIYVDSQGTGGAISNTMIVNNLCYNCIGQGVSTNTAVTSLTYMNNTIYNEGNESGAGGGPMLVIAPSSSGCIGNNNVCHTLGSPIEENGVVTTCTYDRNTFYLCSSNTLDGGTVTNSLTTNPLFVTVGSDFHLQSGSPAKNTGNATGAPVYDIELTQRSTTAPSRGCYE